MIGSFSVLLSINAVSFGAVDLPLQLSVVDPAIASGVETAADRGTVAAVWGVVVTVGGIDVSDSIVGEVVVDAEEGSARVADLTLHLAPGTPVNVASWTGRPVTIDFVDMASGAPLNSVRLFTGRVDLPTISPRRGLLALRCTDNRQAIISGMSRADLLALLPDAHYSPAVFDNGASSFVFAGDLLSTVRAALDISPTGGVRVTAWAAKDIPDFEFTDDNVLDESITVDMAERSQMVNRVDIDFSYRFPRLKAEGYQVNYDYLALHSTSFGYWVRDGNMFLQRAAVEAAIEQSGGSIVSMTWIPLPTTAQVIPGTGGAPAGAWLPNPATDSLSCLGFSAVVSFDYAQTIEETHKISAVNADSIAALGTLKESMSGALEGVYDDPVAVEQSVLLYRQQVTRIPPKNLAAVVVGVTNSVNATLTADSDRAAANAAMETLIFIAFAKIEASHRQSRVSFEAPCNPVADVIHTAVIEAGGVLTRGKVARVKHRLDADSGRAISEISLAVCTIDGAGGLVQPSVNDPASETTDGETNVLAAPVVTWNGLYGEDNVITVTFPGVEEAERAKANTVIERAVSWPLALNTLEVTA